MPDPAFALRCLARAWCEWQDEPSFPFTPDHCINGTRACIDAARTLGVKLRPVSVDFTLFNRPAWELYRSAVKPADWPEHAWSVGVDRDASVDHDGKWGGHLMAEGAGQTVDLSARQFHRPGRLVVPEPWVMPSLPHDRTADFTDTYSQVLLIRRWPENNRWRGAPGWQPNPDVADELAARTRVYLR
jgi:hypothetical protein